MEGYHALLRCWFVLSVVFTITFIQETNATYDTFMYYNDAFRYKTFSEQSCHFSSLVCLYNVLISCLNLQSQYRWVRMEGLRVTMTGVSWCITTTPMHLISFERLGTAQPQASWKMTSSCWTSSLRSQKIPTPTRMRSSLSLTARVNITLWGSDYVKVRFIVQTNKVNSCCYLTRWDSFFILLGQSSVFDGDSILSAMGSSCAVCWGYVSVFHGVRLLHLMQFLFHGVTFLHFTWWYQGHCQR